MPDPGSPSKIYVGAAADIFVLQEPVFQLFPTLDRLVCETVPYRRSAELTLNSGRTLLVSQTACAKDEVEKEILRFFPVSRTQQSSYRVTDERRINTYCAIPKG
jgi:hypothetical protein